MFKICRALLLLLMMWPVLNAARKSRYLLKWNTFDCHNNWPIITNISCRIVDIEKLSVDLELSEPLTAVTAKFTLLVPRPTQKTQMVLFEGNLDGCQFLRDGIQQNRLVLSIFQNMIRDSNLGKQCPINQGPLYFHNISGLDNFPAFLPETDFTLFVIFNQPNTTSSLDLTLKGSVLERARQKLWQ